MIKQKNFDTPRISEVVISPVGSQHFGCRQPDNLLLLSCTIAGHQPPAEVGDRTLCWPFKELAPFVTNLVGHQRGSNIFS